MGKKTNEFTNKILRETDEIGDINKKIKGEECRETFKELTGYFKSDEAGKILNIIRGLKYEFFRDNIVLNDDIEKFNTFSDLGSHYKDCIDYLPEKEIDDLYWDAYGAKLELNQEKFNPEEYEEWRNNQSSDAEKDKEKNEEKFEDDVKDSLIKKAVTQAATYILKLILPDPK